MGNRAVVAFKSQPTVGMYLHWNGGPESILAFIEAAKQLGARNPEGDETYAFAALVTTTGLFIHSSSKHGGASLISMGVGPLDSLDTDNYDNGLYWIGYDWKIVEREHTSSKVKSIEDLSESAKGQYHAMVTAIIDAHAASSEVING